MKKKKGRLPKRTWPKQSPKASLSISPSASMSLSASPSPELIIRKPTSADIIKLTLRKIEELEDLGVPMSDRESILKGYLDIISDPDCIMEEEI